MGTASPSRDVRELRPTVIGVGAQPTGEPGELMRLVAAGLTSDGFEVRLPEYEDGCRLGIGCHGARCTLSVSDFGHAEWEWSPWASGEAEPKQIADLATALLTGRVPDYCPRQGSGYGRPGITFKGIVGMELRARGFGVELQVFEDEDYLDAHAEIMVTSPDTGEGAKVTVADDGSVTWSRDYWAEAATVIWEPQFCGWIAEPAKLAATSVAAITPATSQVVSGQQVSGTAAKPPLPRRIRNH